MSKLQLAVDGTSTQSHTAVQDQMCRLIFVWCLAGFSPYVVIILILQTL